jgi:hypothetical protein
MNFILSKIRPGPPRREESEFTDSTRDEIRRQLEELEKHSGKEANDIHPQPERFVLKCRKKKKSEKTRERPNATVVHSIDQDVSSNRK